MAENKENDPPTYSARDVRQAHTVLRTRRKRVIFIAGLVVFVLVAAVGGVLTFM